MDSKMERKQSKLTLQRSQFSQLITYILMSLSSQRGYRSFSPSLTSDLLAVPVPVPCSKFPVRSDRDAYTVLNYTGFQEESAE